MESLLDDRVLSLSSPEKLLEEFTHYKLSKTDVLKDQPEVIIKMGADGVTVAAFEQQLTRHTINISSRIASGKYFFGPFREITISKDYTLKLKTAKKLGKTRTLSIACMRDTLVQRVLHKVLAPFSEELFSNPSALDRASFAYRPGKSAPAAARLTYSYIKEGYIHALDADVRKFFDEIPHDKLFEGLDSLFESHPLVRTLLKRFVKADRVPAESYSKESVFYNKKPTRHRRTMGIPQGGVLSGLVANLYLYPFDCWVINELSRLHDIKYVRYADDFVILARDKDIAARMRDSVREKLRELGLVLHTDPAKTRVVDLSHKRTSLHFVGFSISPTGIRIKPSNLAKFKRRFAEKLWKPIKWSRPVSPDDALKFIITRKLQFKVLGNWASEVVHCDNCGKLKALRSWVAFFATVTDVQQLRSLDRWIRKVIHDFMVAEYGRSTEAQDLQDAGLERLERVYYDIRKNLNQLELCKCESWETNKAYLEAAHSEKSAVMDLHDEIS